MLRLSRIGDIKQLAKMRNRVAVFIWLARKPLGSPKKPLSIPVETMIRATPMTGIMPIPTLRASFHLKPEIRAPRELPIKFPDIAQMMNTIQNKTNDVIWSEWKSDKKSKLAPTQTKNIGTKNAYPMVFMYSARIPACGVFLMKIPAMNAPMIAVNPKFSANVANRKQMPRPLVRTIMGA